MNKNLLITEVAEKAGISKKDSAKIVEIVFDSITDALKSGDKVQLVGFGCFEVRERAARVGRNPQTKTAIDIPASKVPVFKAGKALREEIK